jgi:hypothetical protein
MYRIIPITRSTSNRAITSINDITQKKNRIATNLIARIAMTHLKIDACSIV